MMSKFLDLTGVANLWNNIKTYITQYVTDNIKTVQNDVTDICNEINRIVSLQKAKQFFTVTTTGGEFEFYTDGASGEHENVKVIEANTPTKVTIDDDLTGFRFGPMRSPGAPVAKSKAISADLSTIDASNITDFSETFTGSNLLESVNLTGWNTSNATKLGDVKYRGGDYLEFGMFMGCSSLTSLDLSSFDTSKVQDFCYMFYGCTNLEYLDLSNFSTESVTSVMYGVNKYIFYGCYSLNHIKCKQAFKDWCITNQNHIALPDAMREGGTGTWEIID